MTTELTDDTCATCGFDSADRTRQETIAVVARAAELVDRAFGPIDGPFLDEHPEDDTWPPLEYVEHIRKVFAHSRLISSKHSSLPNGPSAGRFHQR